MKICEIARGDGDTACDPARFAGVIDRGHIPPGGIAILALNRSCLTDQQRTDGDPIGAGAEAGLRGSDADWVRAANRSSRGGLDELVSQRRRALDRRISKVARKIIRRNSAKGLNRPLTPKELAGVLARRR